MPKTSTIHDHGIGNYNRIFAIGGLPLLTHKHPSYLSHYFIFIREATQEMSCLVQ